MIFAVFVIEILSSFIKIFNETGMFKQKALLILEISLKFKETLNIF